jgi:hypothetical protein
LHGARQARAGGVSTVSAMVAACAADAVAPLTVMVPKDASVPAGALSASVVESPTVIGFAPSTAVTPAGTPARVSATLSAPPAATVCSATITAGAPAVMVAPVEASESANSLVTVIEICAVVLSPAASVATALSRCGPFAAAVESHASEKLAAAPLPSRCVPS